MAAARAQLQREHGAGAAWKVMANLAEYQARAGADGYRWDGQAWFGGDIHRPVFKSEGEATRGEGVEAAELQVLYSRAVGVYTDLQLGVRQDFEPRARTYATVGFETLLPYWFDVEGAAFLSNKGASGAPGGGLRSAAHQPAEPATAGRVEFRGPGHRGHPDRFGPVQRRAGLAPALRDPPGVRALCRGVLGSQVRQDGRPCPGGRRRCRDHELVVGVRAFF